MPAFTVPPEIARKLANMGSTYRIVHRAVPFHTEESLERLERKALDSEVARKQLEQVRRGHQVRCYLHHMETRIDWHFEDATTELEALTKAVTSGEKQERPLSTAEQKVQFEALKKENEELKKASGTVTTGVLTIPTAAPEPEPDPADNFELETWSKEDLIKYCRSHGRPANNTQTKAEILVTARDIAAAPAP